MIYVWLIWDHGEDGPETLFAFSGREPALAYALQHYAVDADKQAEVRAKFPPDTKLDEELAWELHFGAANSWPLTSGWGGLHLTVTKVAAE